jgi:hypothetical protein
MPERLVRCSEDALALFRRRTLGNALTESFTSGSGLLEEQLTLDERVDSLELASSYALVLGGEVAQGALVLL